MELACERVAGELLDLDAGGLLNVDIEPIEVALDLQRRYEALWEELTGEWLIPPGEERERVAERLRRLNTLGFDVKEIELADADTDRPRLRVSTRVSEPGHYRQHLYQRTGLVAEENQARRLLNDLASFRTHLERKTQRPVSEVVAANRWLSEVYEPVAASIPAELRDKLDPVEVYHELLEHRWFLSEAAGRDVGTEAALASYFEKVLSQVPDDLPRAEWARTATRERPTHRQGSATMRDPRCGARPHVGQRVLTKRRRRDNDTRGMGSTLELLPGRGVRTVRISG